MEKKEFIISVFTEDNIGLLNKVSIIFTRRHINIESITASESEMKGVHRYTIVIYENEQLVKKVVAQLNKQVEILKSFYHKESDVVHQEIALFKVATSVLVEGQAEEVIRKHNARVLSFDENFTVIEKTGHKKDTQKLFDELNPFGILQFARSGMVAITKSVKEFKEYFDELEIASQLN